MSYQINEVRIQDEIEYTLLDEEGDEWKTDKQYFTYVKVDTDDEYNVEVQIDRKYGEFWDEDIIAAFREKFPYAVLEVKIGDTLYLNQ